MKEQYLAKLTIYDLEGMTREEHIRLYRWLADKSEKSRLFVEQGSKDGYAKIYNSKLIK